MSKGLGTASGKMRHPSPLTTMPRSSVVLIAFLFHIAAQAANDGLGTLHEFKDWVVGCDNLRACEAQGYGSEAEGAPEGGRAALIVRRAAGPGQPPVLRFVYSSFDNAPQPQAGQAVAVHVGALRFQLPPLKHPGEVDSEVPPAQVPALLAAALKGDHILLSAGTNRWSVSLSGAAAALLKMDDLQGRVGTPGALTRRGSRPEARVPVPPPPRPARLPPTTDADHRLEPRLLAALPRSDDDCPDFAPERSQGHLVRLTPTSVLVAQVCFQGAYQAGSRLWQVDDRPPFRARPVPLPQPDGSTNDTAVIESMSGGETLSVHEAAKARGIGDCWATREWIWTGTGLALVSATESPCRLFEAGGLPITLWRNAL